jgi:hypothetical protein
VQFWRAKANKIKDLAFLAAVANNTLEEVAEAVLEKFPNKKQTGLEYAPVKSPKVDKDEAGPSAPSSESSTIGVISAMVVKHCFSLWLVACFFSSGLSLNCCLKETAVCPT